MGPQVSRSQMSWSQMNMVLNEVFSNEWSQVNSSQLSAHRERHPIFTAKSFHWMKEQPFIRACFAIPEGALLSVFH